MPTAAEFQQMTGVCMAILHRFIKAAGGVAQISMDDVQAMSGKFDLRIVDGKAHVIAMDEAVPPKSSVILAPANALDRLKPPR